jgi:defect in organelle trafficking protein DotD
MDFVMRAILFKTNVSLFNAKRGVYIAVFSVLAGVTLGACAPTVKHPQMVAAPDRVSAMLADAADKASNALQTLAAVEQSKSPPANLAPIDNAPPELRRAVTIAWIGPVDTITEILAERASYRFKIYGDFPPVPVVVNIDTENRPIVEVLRDIGLQLGGRGDVRVDTARRIIELHYAPMTAPS